MIYAFFQVPNLQLGWPISINIFEVQTIILEFMLHKEK